MLFNSPYSAHMHIEQGQGADKNRDFVNEVQGRMQLNAPGMCAIGPAETLSDRHE